MEGNLKLRCSKSSYPKPKKTNFHTGVYILVLFEHYRLFIVKLYIVPIPMHGTMQVIHSYFTVYGCSFQKAISYYYTIYTVL